MKWWPKRDLPLHTNQSLLDCYCARKPRHLDHFYLLSWACLGHYVPRGWSAEEIRSPEMFGFWDLPGVSDVSLSLVCRGFVLWNWMWFVGLFNCVSKVCNAGSRCSGWLWSARWLDLVQLLLCCGVAMACLCWWTVGGFMIFWLIAHCTA